MSDRHRMFLVLSLTAAVTAGVAHGQIRPVQPRGEQSTQVYVEDSPDAVELFDHAKQLRQQQRLGDAANAYQKIIEQYPHRLMPRSEGVMTSAWRLVREALSSDVELLETYRGVYGSAAERALAQATLDEAELEAVITRYPLSKAAMDAALRLAAIHLEQAEPLAAAVVLESVRGHPDLSRVTQRWMHLRAAAMLYSGRLDAFDRLVENLGEASRTELTALRASVRLPRGAAGQEVPQSVPLDAVAAPLWSEDTAAADLHVGQPTNVRLARVATGNTTGSFRWLPAADGDQLIVNDAWSVMALDRHSGRRLWSYIEGEDNTEDSRLRAMFGNMRSIKDVRGVAVTGDFALAIMGEVSPFSDRLARLGGRRVPRQTTLLCLDRADGAVAWRRTLEELDPSLSTAYLHGTPMVVRDRVMVLARRTQTSPFHDAYLLCVGVADGRLLWRRHLSSASIHNRNLVSSSIGQMTTDGQRVFVNDHIGSIACIDARHGEIVWLHINAPDADARQPTPTRDGSAVSVVSNPPLLTEAGLVCVPSAAGAKTLVLDPQTGQKLREVDGPGRDQGAWAIAVPGGVLVVGETVQMLDGRTLARRWSRDLGAASGAGSFGRPAVTQQHLLVPTRDRLVVLKLSDGTPVANTPLEVPGNVVAMDNQVVIVSARSVRSYMAWPAAYAQLVEQIKRDTTDPAPGLALAHVALTADKSQAVLEGVDAALAALQQRLNQRLDPPAAVGQVNPVQQKIMAQLLAFANLKHNGSATLRRAIFDRMATVTATPADEVAYHLSLAELLVELKQHEDAVDHLQAVLIDPMLAGQLFQNASGARQAGLEAKLRLQELVRLVGPNVYAKYDTLSASRMVEIVNSPQRTAEALVELARQYPLSRSAPAALFLAAELSHKTDDHTTALMHLRAAYDLSSDATMLQRIAGRIVELYTESGQPARARQWLQRLRREHENLAPLRDGRPTPIDTWLAELDTRSAPKHRLPSIELPLTLGEAIYAKAQRPLLGARDTPRPRDYFVTLGESEAGQPTVSLHRQPGKPAWQAALPSAEVTVLATTPEQVLLWVRDRQSLIALNTDNGTELWPIVSVAKILGEIAEADRRAVKPLDQRRALEILNMRGLRPPEQARGAVFHIDASDTSICVADEAGRAVGIDRDTGKVLWRMACPVEKLHQVVASNDALVMRGVTSPGDDAQSSTLTVLDPTTGEPRFPAIDEKGTIHWVGLAEGMLFQANSTNLTAHRLSDGGVAWRVPLDPQRPTTWGAASDEAVVLANQDGALLMVDAMTGRVVNRRLGAPTRLGTELDAQPVDRHWYLMTGDHLVAMSPDGKELWRDAISARVQRVAQAVGENHVALLTVQPARALNEAIGFRLQLHPGLAEPLDQAARREIRGEGEPMLYRLYVLDRHSGTVLMEQPLGPLAQPIDPRGVMMLDRRLLLPTTAATVVINGQ